MDGNYFLKTDKLIRNILHIVTLIQDPTDIHRCVISYGFPALMLRVKERQKVVHLDGTSVCVLSQYDSLIHRKVWNRIYYT